MYCLTEDFVDLVTVVRPLRARPIRLVTLLLHYRHLPGWACGLAVCGLFTRPLST